MISAESPDTKADREINDIFFFCGEDTGQEWKRSPAGGRISAFLFGDLFFMLSLLIVLLG